MGALARDLLLEYVHGIRAPQATRDVDVAVAVQDWARYEQLIDALKNTYRFEPTNWPYRLRSAEGLYVDVIPFGLVEGPGRTISWPPHAFVMTMLGFEEAYNSIIKFFQVDEMASSTLVCLLFMRRPYTSDSALAQDDPASVRPCASSRP